MNVQSNYLSREQAAAFLHVTPKTLANWASQGKGPKFRKPGGRLVLYAIDDLEAWINGVNP
jgi:predicted DNA-binding transcriptional regulator AlpA